ncbi:DEAD-domain-containing protein [Exidia glandulosa HHB12029]|uniref:ATP-dependent RNA helicase n=1 Tax=Exidia glandulosa HHB12029 TaxID=1314781 RepID=A0A165MGS8_EXIGL|nr:DEAD-domain-containing protein [Exidia glandulosa HHB12029]
MEPHVSEETFKAVTGRPMRMTTMTPVQAQVMALFPNLASPPQPFETDQTVLEGRKDLLIQAKTGTGKTLAFLLPAVEQRVRTLKAIGEQAAIDAGQPDDTSIAIRAERAFARTNVGTLIISPTRELATQIANEAIRVTTHQPEFEVRLFVGGVSKGMQMRDFMRGRRDIVVATTGRLLDLIKSEPEVRASLKQTQLLVLDEADTLLDMGFRDDIEMLKNYLPSAPLRQTFLCSATISTAIKQVTKQYLRPDHVFISTVSGDSSPVHAHVKQYHTVLPSAAEQIPHIIRLIAHDQMTSAGKSKVVIFLPTTKKTQLFATIVRELARSNLPAARTNVYELHSKRTQESRTNTSNMFRNDTSGASVLITSDVSARGVDYPGVTRVVQIGMPGSSEIYIHRVGRTGRAGTNGRGDLVLLPWEHGFVTWQLTEVPLKPLTTNELIQEVEELATEFEADPSKFVGERRAAEGKRQVGRGQLRYTEPATYPPGVPARLQSMPESLSHLQGRLDEAAINETFASLLGYYVAKSHELRVPRDVILEGLKDWAVEACGLPTKPYVSPRFLDQIGFGDNRTKHFGQQRRPDFGRSSSQPHWMGRGTVRARTGNSGGGYGGSAGSQSRY